MVLPNGESISARGERGAPLVTDTDWIGIDFTTTEGRESKACRSKTIVEEAFGEEAVATALRRGHHGYSPGDVTSPYRLGEVCAPSMLYCRNPDDAGGTPSSALLGRSVARIRRSVRRWVAQGLDSALEARQDIGDASAGYAALPKALADSNGDGRIFTPKAERTPQSPPDDGTTTRTRTTAKQRKGSREQQEATPKASPPRYGTSSRSASGAVTWTMGAPSIASGVVLRTDARRAETA
jgi:hypothetical protein